MATNNTQQQLSLAKKTEIALTTQDIDTLTAVGAIPPGTPAQVVDFFRRACGETGLSPFKRQIYLIKRGDKYTLQTGIDGYRTIADRTHKYAGNDDYVFDGGKSQMEVLHDSGTERPTTATATVWKIIGGVRCPFSATVRWKEYYPGDALGFQWRKMPFLMLGKCAEALALRKAFPEETVGIFVEEEMQAPDAEPLVKRAQVPKKEHFTKGGLPLPVVEEKKEPATPFDYPEESEMAKPEKLSPKKKRDKSSAEQMSYPFRQAMLKRLEVGGYSTEQFIEVCLANEWIRSRDKWPLPEIALEKFLDPDNWTAIQEELEALRMTL